MLFIRFLGFFSKYFFLFHICIEIVFGCDEDDEVFKLELNSMLKGIVLLQQYKFTTATTNNSCINNKNNIKKKTKIH